MSNCPLSSGPDINQHDHIHPYLGSPAGSIPPFYFVFMLIIGGEHSHAEEAHMREFQLHSGPIISSKRSL